MFATDRDLVVLEPRLFEDVAFASQTLFTSDAGEVMGDGLSLVVRSGDFESLGIGAGYVASIEGVAAEVTARHDAETLLVSRVRASIADAALPLIEGDGLKVRIASFRPQIAAMHEQVLTALGIGAGAGSELEEGSIVNPAALARVEALGALHLAYAGAAALVGTESLLWQKAQMYQARLSAERQRVSALVDLDGDGVGDVVRRMNVMQFVRR